MDIKEVADRLDYALDALAEYIAQEKNITRKVHLAVIGNEFQQIADWAIDLAKKEG